MSDHPDNPVATGSLRTEGSDHNIVDLVARFTQQGAHLARQQVSLMQAEVREAATDVKAAVAAMAGAIVFGIAGLGVLLMGIAYFVGNALDDVALGTILVGGATLVVALILYASARKKIDGTNLKPDRSIDTIADTPAAATGHSPSHEGR